MRGEKGERGERREKGERGERREERRRERRNERPLGRAEMVLTQVLLITVVLFMRLSLALLSLVGTEQVYGALRRVESPIDRLTYHPNAPEYSVHIDNESGNFQVRKVKGSLEQDFPGALAVGSYKQNVENSGFNYLDIKVYSHTSL